MPAGTAGTAAISASAGRASTNGGSGSASAGAASTNGGSGSASAGAASTSGGSANGAGASNVGTAGQATGGAVDKFSFFVTSQKAMVALSKSPDGFGGDLRYGEATGLAGADKICSEIAESSMPGSTGKQWRAFLSTATVNAADRIGNGPWYDRTGRLVAGNLTLLLTNRPGADAAIAQDLPNESGIPNHQPDPGMPQAVNSHVLTGSDATGKLFGATATCLDWTSNATDNAVTGRPRAGYTWSSANRTNWISGMSEGGCGASVQVTTNGDGDAATPTVASGGGYGAIYCFALTP